MNLESLGIDHERTCGIAVKDVSLVGSVEGCPAVSGAISKVEGAFESAYFTVPLFPFSVDFHRFGSISNIFGGHFSPFLSFFNFQIRYTRTTNPRLMYSPSPTRVKAPQLGPKG
jgi:hypothetical protein